MRKVFATILCLIAAVVLAFVVTTAIAADAQDPSSTVERIADVASLMKAKGIPGMSVAVIHDYKIAWAKGYGVTEKGRKQTNFVTSMKKNPKGGGGAAPPPRGPSGPGG